MIIFLNTLRTKGFFQVDPASPGNPQLISYFPIGMIKYHDQKQHREETVITTDSSYRGDTAHSVKEGVASGARAQFVVSREITFSPHTERRGVRGSRGQDIEAIYETSKPASETYFLLKTLHTKVFITFKNCITT